MTKVSRRVLAVAAGLVITAGAGSTALASHAWGNYHWARTTPGSLTLKVGNNMTTAWQTHYNSAVSDWNSAAALNLASVAGTANKHCSMVSGTVQVCNRRYGNNGWLGLASINITGGEHITQGSAKMNDTYFDTATYNNPNEKLHVVCQEIGHTFGLGHTSEDGSSLNTCMDYFSNTGANAGSTLSTKINQHDKDMLASIYAHADSTTTTAATIATSPAGRSDVTDDPSTWGDLTRQSENGRSSTYERTNRDGSRTITDVRWTIEAAAACPGCDHRYDH